MKIEKEGGYICSNYDSVWVKLTYDVTAIRMRLEITDKPGGQILVIGGVTGINAKNVFQKFNTYFFGL